VSGKQTLEGGILQRRIRENSENDAKNFPVFVLALDGAESSTDANTPAVTFTAPSSLTAPTWIDSKERKTGARLACGRRGHSRMSRKGKSAP
jgi:hypothetical protein